MVDGVSFGDEKQEYHLTCRHSVADVICRIRSRAQYNRGNDAEGFFQTQQDPSSPKDGLEKDDRKTSGENSSNGGSWTLAKVPIY